MKSTDESAVISQSCNVISESQDDSDGLQHHHVVGADNEAVVDLKKSSMEALSPPADLGDEIALQAGNDQASLGQNGSCQLWLYKCVLDGCSAAFELLADLRTHFICHHQTKGQMCVPCCFCMMEFPCWNSSVTTHIASHVHIHSVSCVECHLKFQSKNLLMKHLYSTHTGLSNGVSFDVSINNYERRRLKVQTQLANANSNRTTSGSLDVSIVDAVKSTVPVSSCSLGNSLGNNRTDQNIPAKINSEVEKIEKESSVRHALSTSNSPTFENSVNSNCCTLSDDDAAEHNMGIDALATISESESHQSSSLFDNPQGIDKSGARNGRRKGRKPMRVAAEENEEENNVVVEGENQAQSIGEDHWVEILPATQAMVIQCSKCSYTCNTELQLKVHMYECHENPHSSTTGTMCWFTCRFCGNVSDNVSLHRLHVAHHREKSAVPVRMFVCVYCDRRSDSMEVLEEHILHDHPTETLKFEVVQLVVAYLQDMMACPLCKCAFSWKEDLLRHFGAVHRLDGLVHYLDSEYTSETFPTTCRVPRSLFKDLIAPKPSSCNSIETKAEADMTAQIQSASFIREKKCVDNELLDLSAARKSMKDNVVSSESRTYFKEGSDMIEDNSMLRKKQLLSGGTSEDQTKSLYIDDVDAVQRFHCDSCDFSANSHVDLVGHMSLHKYSSMEYVAPTSEFTNFTQQHKERRGKKFGLRYRCELCPFATSKSQNLRRHLNIHLRADSMQEGFRCGYCSFAHKQRRCIIFHLSRYHSELPVRFSNIIDGEDINVTTTIPQKSHHSPVSSAPSAHHESANLSSEFKECSGQPVSSSKGKQTVLPRSIEAGGGLSAVSSLEQQLPLSMIYATPVKCPVCEFTNRVRVNLIRHIRLYHGNSSTKRKSMDEAPEIIKHASAGTSLQEVSIATGSFDVSSKMSMSSVSSTLGVFVPSAEVPVVTQAKSTPCQVSFASSKPESSATINEGTGSSATPFYRCKVCGYQSARQYSTKQHLLSMHRGSARFRCVICEHMLHTWRELAVHVWRTHPGQLPLVARHTFKDHASYLRDGITKIIGYHHMKQDVAKTNFEQNVNPEVPIGSSEVLKQSTTSFDSTDALEEMIDEEQPSKKLCNFVDRRRKSSVTTMQCRKCAYANDNATVMRQHVMAHHLHYKPYACPYCDISPRYVKSFPITKHVRIRHPHVCGTQRTFLYLRDEEMEKKVRNGYRLLRQNTVRDVANVDQLSNQLQSSYNSAIGDQANEASPIIKREVDYNQSPVLENAIKKKALPSESPYRFSKVLDEHMKNAAETDPKSAKKVVFSRCCFCGLVARWRADLRYHLMREIGYKPFKCGLCEETTGKIFAEPTRPALAKHMRLRHSGLQVDVVEQRDPAKEDEIDRLLERCASSSLDVMPDSSRASVQSAYESVTSSKQDSDVISSYQSIIANLDQEDCVSLNINESRRTSGEMIATSNTVHNNTIGVNVDKTLHTITIQKSKKKKRAVIGKSRLRRCQFCTYRGPSIKRINKHLMEVHNYAPFKCSYCEFTEYYPSALRRHWHENHLELSFSYVKVDINGTVMAAENRGSIPLTATATTTLDVDEANMESDDSSSSAEVDDFEDLTEQSHNQDSILTSTNSVTAFGRNTARKSTSGRPNFTKRETSNGSEILEPLANVAAAIQSDSPELTEVDEDVRFCCESCIASFATSDELATHSITCHSNIASGSQSSVSNVDAENDSVEFDSDESSSAVSEHATNFVRRDGDLKLVVRLVDISWGLGTSKSNEGGTASSESDT